MMSLSELLKGFTCQQMTTNFRISKPITHDQRNGVQSTQIVFMSQLCIQSKKYSRLASTFNLLCIVTGFSTLMLMFTTKK